MVYRALSVLFQHCSKQVFLIMIRYEISNFVLVLRMKQFIIESRMKQNPTKAQDNSPINDFNGHYQFLNNDHPAWICYESILYPSANIAFHAARTNDPTIRQSLQNVESYQKLKEIALSIQNPGDWNSRRHRVMEKIIRDKFKRNK